jgi:YceG-like family
LARDRNADLRGERSEEERERAREERERRRMERTGEAKSPPPVPPLPPPSAAAGVAAQAPGAAAGVPAPLQPVQPPGDLAHRLAPAQPHRPRRHSPHLHRPHLHRPHASAPRGLAARVSALLALVLVLGGLAAGAFLLLHRPGRPAVPPPAKIVKVTIPEGYTRAQIAALAHADGLRGSYLSASKDSVQLDPAHYGAPAGTPNLEGFLFPATYELYAGTRAAQLVSDQLAAFRENFGGGEAHRAKVLGVTPYQLLIVASIIEREVAIPHDRPLVAAVVYNRLRLHMTLGVDSTLRYALHDFAHPLTEAQLASNSPYNTRTHQGLPPTPISNPGAAAVAAAARPAKVSYLYYVSGADGCGEQVFSTSYAQFEKNAAAYREAIGKNGGRVPTCKKGT